MPRKKTQSKKQQQIDSQVEEEQMQELSKNNVLNFFGPKYSHLAQEIFLQVLAFVPAFPFLFTYRRVSKEWKAFIEQKMYDLVETLDVVPHFIPNAGVKWKEFSACATQRTMITKKKSNGKSRKKIKREQMDMNEFFNSVFPNLKRIIAPMEWALLSFLRELSVFGKLETLDLVDFRRHSMCYDIGNVPSLQRIRIFGSDVHQRVAKFYADIASKYPSIKHIELHFCKACPEVVSNDKFKIVQPFDENNEEIMYKVAQCLNKTLYIRSMNDQIVADLFKFPKSAAYSATHFHFSNYDLNRLLGHSSINVETLIAIIDTGITNQWYTMDNVWDILQLIFRNRMVSHSDVIKHCIKQYKLLERINELKEIHCNILKLSLSWHYFEPLSIWLIENYPQTRHLGYGTHASLKPDEKKEIYDALADAISQSSLKVVKMLEELSSTSSKLTLVNKVCLSLHTYDNSVFEYYLLQIPADVRIKEMLEHDVMNGILRSDSTSIHVKLKYLISNVPGNIFHQFILANPFGFHVPLQPSIIDIIAAQLPEWNLDLMNTEGNTVLHAQKSAESFAKLVTLNANVNVQNSRGETPVMHAIDNHMDLNFSVLWSKINHTLKDNDLNNLLHHLFFGNRQMPVSLVPFLNSEEFWAMFSQPNNSKLLPIAGCIASYSYSLPILDSLIDNVANFYTKPLFNGEIAAFYILEHGYNRVYLQTLNAIDGISLPEPKTGERCIWHHLLAASGIGFHSLEQLTKYLPQINHVAMIENVPTTPLMVGIENSGVNEELLIQLVKQGAHGTSDWNMLIACLNFGYSRSKLAELSAPPTTAQLLHALRISKMESLSSATMNHLSSRASEFAPLLSIIDAQKGNSLLHLWCEKKMFKEIEWVIDSISKQCRNDVVKALTSADTQGNTILHYLVQQANAEQKKIRELITKIVEFVPNEKTLLNHQNQEGETALHLASRGKYSLVISAFLSAGANVNVKNSKGQTASNVCNDANIKARLDKHGSKKAAPKRKHEQVVEDDIEEDEEEEKMPARKKRR